jgi:four helix bundle protein
VSGPFEYAGVLGRVQAEPAAAPPVLGRFARSQPGHGLRLAGVDFEVLEQRGQEVQPMSLKIYPVVLELVRRLSPVIRLLRSRSSVLAEQMERALISVPLNVAEGAYSRGKNRQARFQSAAASARETLACLETAEAMGFIGPLEPELGAMLHRIIGTLVRLIEPRR